LRAYPQNKPCAGAFLPWSNRDRRQRQALGQGRIACIPNKAKKFYGGCSGKLRG
jgi:hypothetical protein